MIGGLMKGGLMKGGLMVGRLDDRGLMKRRLDG